MFDPEMLAQLEMGYQASLSKPKPKKGGRGGTLTSLISEGGAIGGGALGASIGTGILPGIGTLVGGGIGAGIGAFTGRLAENKVRDNRLGIGDAAKEGAVSTVLGAGPIRLAKTAVGAAKATKGGASLADALIEAGSKATKSSLAAGAGKKLTQASDDLVIKEFRLTPTQLANFKKKYGEDATQVIKKYGLSGKDSEAIKQTVIDPLQGEFDTIASKIPAIPTKTIQEAFKKKYSKLINSAVQDNKAVGLQLKKQADEIVKKYGDEVAGDEIGMLRREFDDLVSYADKAANPARYGVNKRSADALRKVLQDTADSVGLTSSKGQTFKEVGRELSKLRQLTENIGKQENLGRGNLPFSLGNTPGAVIGAAGGPVTALAGYAGNAFINSPIGRKTLAGAVEKTGQKLTAAADSNAYSAGKIAGRILPVSGLNAAAGQDFLPNSTSQIPSPTTTSTNTPSAANMSELSQTDSQMSMSDSPFAPQNLEAAIQQIVANGGGIDDVTKFVSLASAIQKMQESGTGKAKLNATQLQQANNAQSGIDSIGTIRQTLADRPNAAKLASLPGGSFTQSLTGTGSYSAAVNNAVDVIGRLRSGGAINVDEEKRFRSLLPSTFDDPATVEYKLNALEELFSRFVNPQSMGGPTSLEEALLAQGAY